MTALYAPAELVDVLDAIADHDFERPCKRCGSMLRLALECGYVVRGGLDEPMFSITPAGEEVIA